MITFQEDKKTWVSCSGRGYLYVKGTKEDHNYVSETKNGTYYHKKIRDIQGRLLSINEYKGLHGTMIRLNFENDVTVQIPKSEGKGLSRLFKAFVVAFNNADLTGKLRFALWLRESNGYENVTFMLKDEDDKYLGSMDFKEVPRKEEIKVNGEMESDYTKQDAWYWGRYETIKQGPFSGATVVEAVHEDNNFEDNNFEDEKPPF